MAKTTRSVFLELNEAKFMPRKSSEPLETLQRFTTQHETKAKEDEEREIELEKQKRKEARRSAAPDSSYRPASLPPPRRMDEDNEELPSFEDEFFIKKRDFQRGHKKTDKMSWSRTNVELLSNRKERREVQRDAEEQKKREREQQEQLQEKELKQTSK